MDSVTDRIRRSLAMRGVRGTARMCAHILLSLFHPEERRREALRAQIDDQFDSTWGVETGGIVRPKETTVTGPNWAHGIMYKAIDPAEFQQSLHNLRADFSNTVFVDFGSGKGRAVLIAGSFPFRKVIGIEYCRDLHEIALRNLARHQGPRRCGSTELLRMDAAEFQPPPEPLLLFFFNPFGKAVMASVVQNVARSLRQNPREITVLYCTPYFADLWEDTGLFDRIQDSPAIFRSRAPSSATPARNNLEEMKSPG